MMSDRLWPTRRTLVHSLMSIRACVASSAVLGTSLALAGSAMAAGEISSVLVELRAATPLTYTVEGQTYTWGLGNNEIMTGFVIDGEAYDFAVSDSRVSLRLDDISGVAEGNPCGVMVERLNGVGTQLAADYPSDGSGSGNCDMEELLSSRIINRGVVDLFSNTTSDAKNIERADFLFDHAVLAPLDNAMLGQSGHVVGEKRGNNPIKMAAVLELDVFGQPSLYGPLVRVGSSGCSAPDLCYSITDLEHDYAFFQNSQLIPQGFPSRTELATEEVAMAYISAAELGLAAGQRYYGFSLFADDVDSDLHVLTDPASFPDDTADGSSVTGDDSDVYGGLSGQFLADSLSVATGQVFFDTDGDSVFGTGDAGISDIGVVLHIDVNSDGVLDPATDTPLHDPIDSDLDGDFQFPGLAEGDYLVVVDESDPDIPGGLVVAPGSNPVPLRIGAGDSDVDDVNVIFVSGDGAGGGTMDEGGADGSGTDGSGTGGGAGTDGGGTSTAGGFEDGDPTTAVNDSFTINQGERLIAPVLGNDNDAVGDGLTIISVSDSSNASIDIVGSTVVYLPAFGFYGSDSFMYTVEDAEGAVSTATVAVEVERFSDINDNAQNDFDECEAAGVNCDNLELETGVNGSGIGGLSWQSVAVLFALFFMPSVYGRWARRHELACPEASS